MPAALNNGSQQQQGENDQKKQLVGPFPALKIGSGISAEPIPCATPETDTPGDHHGGPFEHAVWCQHGFQARRHANIGQLASRLKDPIWQHIIISAVSGLYLEQQSGR